MTCRARCMQLPYVVPAGGTFQECCYDVELVPLQYLYIRYSIQMSIHMGHTLPHSCVPSGAAHEPYKTSQKALQVPHPCTLASS